MLIVTGNTSQLHQIDNVHSLTLELPTAHGIIKFNSKPVVGSDVIVIMSNGKNTVDTLYVVEDMASGPFAAEALRKFLDSKQQNMFKGVVEHAHAVENSAYRSIVVKLEVPDMEQPHYVHYFGLDFYAADPSALKWDTKAAPIITTRNTGMPVDA